MSYSINQATGVGASGDGKALDGAWLGRAITITGDPGMVEWEHTFRDKPPGSSSVMANASSQVATFTPDVAGDTYRVRLRERATSNGTWITTTKVIRVTRDNAGALVNYGICSISFDEVPGEANYGSNETGYASRERVNNAAIVAALDNPWKLAVAAVSVEDITLSGHQTIDGVAITDQRVLVNGQTDRTENGIYVASAFAWERASDMSNAASLLGTTVRVLESDNDLTGWWALTEPTSGTIEIGTTEIEFAQIGGFVLPAEVIPWTPAEMAGAYFEADFTDPTLATMAGDRIDELRSPFGVLRLTRRAGNPTKDPATIVNGHRVMRLDALAELISDSGGPVGNEAHWHVLLTLGDNGSLEAILRVGAKGACNAIGVTTGGRFGAGRPSAVGTPRVDAPDPFSGTGARIVTAQHLPAYGANTIRIDGRAPVATSGSGWSVDVTFNLDGSFGFGSAEVGGTPNNSAVLGAVFGLGVATSADMVRCAEYLKAKWSLAEQAPEIYWMGDSITNGDDLASPSTESFRALLTDRLNAQRVIDSRPAVESFVASNGGKRVGGAWDASNPPMSFQASGFTAWQPGPGNAGIHYSLPFRRSGRRPWTVLSIMGLTNDIVSDDISTDESIARLRYLCAKGREARCFVLLWSTITGSTGFWTAPKEAKRQAVRAWINDESTGEALGPHRVIDSDLAGLVHPTHFVAGVPGNVHPNDVGHQMLSDIGWPVLYQMSLDIESGALSL